MHAISAQVADAATARRLFPRGGDVSRWKTLKAARKLLRDAGSLVDELLLFIEADSRSSLGPDGQPRLEHLALLREKFAEARAIPLRATPLLDGRGLSKAPILC